MNFPTYNFIVDFENPNLSINEMLNVVNNIIEPHSPVGIAMGKDSNIGEGIVCDFIFNDKLYMFKVKGEKHSGNNKVNTLKPVDNKLEQNKIDFVNKYACTVNRLTQFFNELKNPSIKETGVFIRSIIQDVMKEELDIMADMGLEPKSCNKLISKSASIWFRNKLDEIAFNK